MTALALIGLATLSVLATAALALLSRLCDQAADRPWRRD